MGPEGPLGPLGTLGPNRALRARGTKYGTKKYGNDMILLKQNWVVGWRCSAKPVLNKYFQSPDLQNTIFSLRGPVKINIFSPPTF